MEMNSTDDLIANPRYSAYDDKAIDGFIAFCENEMTRRWQRFNPARFIQAMGRIPFVVLFRKSDEIHS